MNIRVLGNRLLVRRVALPELTTGGLHLLGREYPTIGVVEGVGNLVPDEGVIAGDRVWFERKALDTREVEAGLFILDYSLCNLAARLINGTMRVWALNGKVLVRRYA